MHLIHQFQELNQSENITLSNSNTYVIISVVLIILIFIVALLSWFFAYKKKKKSQSQPEGLRFENEVSDYLEEILKKTDFDFIRSTLFSYDSKMYEVDGILISNSLIVVVESKAFHGTLQGDSAQEYLTLSSLNNKKTSFKNPILQNEKHILHIWKTLGKKIPIASLVVFPDDLNIQISNLDSHVILTNVNKLEKEISMLHEFSRQQLPQFRKESIISLLRALSAKSKSEKKKFEKIINRKGQHAKK